MSYGTDMITRHHALNLAAWSAWESAAEGPAKDAAGRHLLRADVAAMNRNEVDYLLETHRAHLVLRAHPSVASERLREIAQSPLNFAG